MLKGKKRASKNSPTKDQSGIKGTKEGPKVTRRKTGLKALLSRFRRSTASSSKSFSPKQTTGAGQTPSSSTTNSLHSTVNSSTTSGESLPMAIKMNANLRTLILGSSMTPAQISYTTSEIGGSFESITQSGAQRLNALSPENSETAITRSMSALVLNRSAGRRQYGLRRINSSNSPATPVSRLRSLPLRTIAATIPENNEALVTEPHNDDVQNELQLESRRVTIASPIDLANVSSRSQTMRTPEFGILPANMLIPSTPSVFSGGSANARQLSLDESSMGISFLYRRDTLDSQKNGPALKKRRFSDVSSYRDIQQMVRKARHENSEYENLRRFMESVFLIDQAADFDEEDVIEYRAIIIDATIDGKPYSNYSKAIVKALNAEKLLLDTVLGVIPNPFMKVLVANIYNRGIVLLIALVRKPLQQSSTVVRVGISSALTRGIQLGLTNFVLGPCFSEEEYTLELAEALLRTIYVELNTHSDKMLRLSLYTNQESATYLSLIQAWSNIEREKTMSEHKDSIPES